MRIADILEHKGDQVLTVTGDTPVARVTERLRLARVGALVVSRDGVHPEGIVSERAIVAALARHGPCVLEMTAAEIMRPLRTCAAHDSVERVMAEMTARRLRYLVVIEHDRLCGIISVGDVVKSCLVEDDRRARIATGTRH
jgi:CBS domain-containing protein